MIFSSVANLDKRPEAELLILPFWHGKQHAEPAADFKKLSAKIKVPLETRDFKGKEGDLMLVYTEGTPEKRIALLGLGSEEKITTEKIRRAYGAVTKLCLGKKISEINVLMPAIPSLSKEHISQGISEGLLLANYVYDKLKHDALKENPTVLVQKVHLIGCSKAELDIAKKQSSIFEAVYYARDLVNGNADEITPQYLAAAATNLAKNSKRIKTTVFDKKRIEKEKMGLILAVNRGSHREPVFVIAEYKGDPRSKDHTVIIGKGVTFDTGGLNIKTVNMETMKCDMGGAAAALGTLMAADKIQLKANFTVVFAATENAVSSNSFKPGDVYQSYAGTTVEIKDTDAEGRLILADMLAYTHKHLKPTRMIDFATLTGSIEIALGPEAAGLFSNNDALADMLLRAGSETSERLWRMPLIKEYREQLKSEVADMRNSTGGRSGGAIIAALFLHEFVGNIPWAHCDIAATAFLGESKRYLPKGATGYGVRLMISFFEHLK